jgi:hypothetical protein
MLLSKNNFSVSSFQAVKPAAATIAEHTMGRFTRVFSRQVYVMIRVPESVHIYDPAKPEQRDEMWKVDDSKQKVYYLDRVKTIRFISDIDSCSNKNNFKVKLQNLRDNTSIDLDYLTFTVLITKINRMFDYNICHPKSIGDEENCVDVTGHEWEFRPRCYYGWVMMLEEKYARRIGRIGFDGSFSEKFGFSYFNNFDRE